MRTTVRLKAGVHKVDGMLISKDDASPVYLRTAARTIDELAMDAPTDDDRKAFYLQAWDAIAALPEDRQQVVAAELQGSSYFSDVPTFRVARLEGELAVMRERNRAALAAAEAAQRNLELANASRRLVYEVTLSEDQGNFKFGGTALPDAAKARLDELIAQLKTGSNNAFIEIEGHTDNAGAPAVNERLGLERAEAVKRYLYEQHQIPLHRINVISYGEDKPVAPNNSRNGRAQNRRIVVKILS
jgi:outer membrane protein OmpA-like peptidoglycan-associated protein